MATTQCCCFAAEGVYTMENKLETLVIVSPGFPENEADTTCIPAMQIFVKALKEICPDLNIIVLSLQYPFFAAEYQWNGVKVIAIGGKDKGRLFRVITWVKAWLVLWRLNRTHHLIGLFSFWLGECAFVGSYFARQYGLGHYTWLLGQDAKAGNKYFHWVKPGSDSLIALSDFLANEFKKNYGVKPAHTIPAGVDMSLFGEAPPVRDIDILGAGSLIPLKQYQFFIEAVGFLKNMFPDIKAVICGKGPERERLQAMVTAMGLENNLTFANELPHTDVLKLMQRSKVFLHPSNYEGFSTVLSEALYSGAHVVSFCQPMESNFNHHYVVKTNEEMNVKVYSLLKLRRLDHHRVLTGNVQDAAKNIVSLFADGCRAH